LIRRVRELYDPKIMDGDHMVLVPRELKN